MSDKGTMGGIWVFVETENGRAKDIGLELLSAARPLAARKDAKLTALVIGENASDAAKEAIGYGADAVILVDDPAYAVYETEAYANVMVKVIRKYDPDVVMIGATSNGRDLSPRVACSLHTGLTADCTGIEIDENSGLIAWTRPTFGGNLMATILCPDTRPQMGTVRPGVFRKSGYDSERPGEIYREDIEPEKIPGLVRLVEHVVLKTEEKTLSDAQIIVAGGRGLGSAENFRMIRELADALGGVVGCSRAVVENGWLPQSFQVGQSGKTVSPKLYIAVGISGAIQHLAGITGAETIVAVNKDPQAPIFEVADFGIVGQASEVVPLMTKAFREALHSV